jgi:hypothetical protein
VERHGAKGVGQRLLVPACAEPGVPSWGRGGLLVQRLLLWPGQEAERRVEARCGHEGPRTLLSSGHGAGVHSHVPLPRVAVGRPRCVGPAVGTSGAVVWPEESPRPPPSLLFLSLLSPPLPLVWFLLLYLFRLPPVPSFPPLGGRDDVEDGGVAAGEARYCPCESPPVANRPEL